MRGALERRLNETWYGERPPSWWMKALSPLYQSLSSLDQAKKRRRASETSACTVVVGNLTVGGSGKTPLTIRLCQLFREAGLKPGVLSRGYGRKGRGLVRVRPGSTAAEVGDEPLLIAARCQVPVVVASDRQAAAADLEQQGCQVLIADDGLQNPALRRDIEICVIDGQRGFGNGQLLPAGPLREDLGRLDSVDHLVINGAASAALQADLDGRTSHTMELAPGLLHSLRDSQSWRLSQYAGCQVNAVAGIANPDRFFRVLEQAGMRPVEHRFADHHPYSPADFEAMRDELPIIMTEKDAVKCAAFGLENAWSLPVNAVLPAALETSLLQQVSDCLEVKGQAE